MWGTIFILKKPYIKESTKNFCLLMTKPYFQSGAPLLGRFNSILAILPKCPDPILGGFSPNRGSNNGSPPPPSLNHKGVTGVHHEGTRDTSGGRGESYDSYDSTGISNRLQRKRKLRWKIFFFGIQKYNLVRAVKNTTLGLKFISNHQFVELTFRKKFNSF